MGVMGLLIKQRRKLWICIIRVLMMVHLLYNGNLVKLRIRNGGLYLRDFFMWVLDVCDWGIFWFLCLWNCIFKVSSLNE